MPTYLYSPLVSKHISSLMIQTRCSCCIFFLIMPSIPCFKKKKLIIINRRYHWKGNACWKMFLESSQARVAVSFETLNGSSMLKPHACSKAWDPLTLVDAPILTSLPRSPPISAASARTQLFPSVEWNVVSLCFGSSCAPRAACPLSLLMKFHCFPHEYTTWWQEGCHEMT